ncbi:uncharacterized protein LOC111400346 [Olea europaea var. sylvestris]|uniref:uncharacterized protein LOC111400346 n=1 Tax=Olea europaea var. sylvestris TaxID=158386 RepID=UPI000C1D40C1|nr:uncharacterized protein LOC111400346 [Olea europaea var. sylvestris]
MYMTQPEGLESKKANKFQANPGEKYWIAVENILKHLRRTKDVFLIYGGDELKVHCWKSSKHETNADSTIEAEYITTSEAVKEAVWIKKFINELESFLALLISHL